jgi:hypothetical protein
MDLSRPGSAPAGLSVAAAVTLLIACGGSPAPTDTTPKDAPSALSGSAAGPSPGAAAKDDDYDDPNESDKPIPMQVTFPAKPKYPKATAKESDCWQAVALTGKHAADFVALVDKCGAPTSAVEYVKPLEGKLHHVKDVSDDYKIKTKGSLCYRFFAVADETIHDIDIVISRDGVIIATDPQHSSVAIIDGTKAWCQDADAELDFRIKITGAGKGGYTFGAWARPK